jgi:hypothetical protein
MLTLLIYLLIHIVDGAEGKGGTGTKSRPGN